MRTRLLAAAFLIVAAAGCKKSLAEETQGKAESLRDQMCGCKIEDKECVKKAEEAFDAFNAGLDQKLSGHVTQEEYYAIGQVKDGYYKCRDERDPR